LKQEINRNVTVTFCPLKKNKKNSFRLYIGKEVKNSLAKMFHLFFEPPRQVSLEANPQFGSTRRDNQIQLHLSPNKITI
jgi:hypothetical protein